MAGARTVASQPVDPGEVPIARLLAILWQRRALVAAALCLGTGLGLLGLTLVTPRYDAHALLLIEPSSIDPAEGLLRRAHEADDDRPVASQIRVLRSRTMARKLARRLNLAEDSAFFLATGDAVPAYDRETAAVERLVAGLSVTRDGESAVLTVAFKSSDAAVSAKIANGVAEGYVAVQLAAKAATLGRASGWLAERLDEAGARLATAEAALEEHLEQHRGTAAGAEGVVGLEIARLRADAVQAVADTAAKRDEFDRLRRLLSDGGTQGTYEMLGGSPVLQNLFALKNQAVRKAAEMSASYGERHPRMLDLRTEIDELNERIDAEQQALASRLEAELGRSSTLERTLLQRLDQLKADAKSEDKARAAQARLEEEVERAKASYRDIADRIEAVRGADTVQGAEVRVISEATTPTIPTFPNPYVFLGLAFTASMTSGVLLAFLMEARERGYRRPEELETDLAAPCLGSLVALPVGKEAVPPWREAVERPGGSFAESLRGAVAELGVRRGERGQALMVTSATPGEGAGAVALSLARAAALSGAKVLLIEARLRSPRLHERLNVPARPGLTEVLVDGHPLEGALRSDRVVVPPLTLLPAGKLDGIWPTRLFGPDGMPVLLDLLRARFDLILVETSAVLEEAEPRALARVCDGVLLTVAFRKVQRQDVLTAANLIERAGGRIKGTLLNQVDPDKLNSYDRRRQKSG